MFRSAKKRPAWAVIFTPRNEDKLSKGVFMKRFFCVVVTFLLIGTAGIFAESRANQTGSADYRTDNPTTRQDMQQRQEAERKQKEAENAQKQAAADQRAKEKAAADARAEEAAKLQAAQDERNRSYIIKSPDGSETLFTPPKN
jgi:phage protein D